MACKYDKFICFTLGPHVHTFIFLDVDGQSLRLRGPAIISGGYFFIEFKEAEFCIGRLHNEKKQHKLHVGSNIYIALSNSFGWICNPSKPEKLIICRINAGFSSVTLTQH